MKFFLCLPTGFVPLQTSYKEHYTEINQHWLPLNFYLNKGTWCFYIHVCFNFPSIHPPSIHPSIHSSERDLQYVIHVAPPITYLTISKNQGQVAALILLSQYPDAFRIMQHKIKIYYYVKFMNINLPKLLEFNLKYGTIWALISHLGKTWPRRELIEWVKQMSLLPNWW